MRIGILTNEYPPNVYGGAGVHVEYLTRELAALDEGRNFVRVLAFGDQAERSPNLEVDGVEAPGRIAAQDPRHVKLFDTLQQNLVMAGMAANLDIVHCHTWYTHFAGCLVKQLQDVPLVLTTHSLEPHRPWKVEQLGTAYNASSWIERTAYENADGVVAVSAAMKHDVQSIYHVAPDKVRVIHNGIDLQQYRPRPDPSVLARFGIRPDVPFVLFVGRITRQKGLPHLLRAALSLDPGVQVVLCAGSPDTDEILAEVTVLVEELRRDRDGVVWIQEMLPKPDVIQVLTHATVFACPSVYEPMGIVNLEAMACEVPVVATATGGIPEVVADGETGLLVPIEQQNDGSGTPLDTSRFEADLAAAISEVLADPARAREMGVAGRRRAVEAFSWATIATRTLDLYRGLL